MNFDIPKPPKKEVVAQEELPRETIGAIESAPLDPVEKMELILVKTNRKPVTDIEFVGPVWREEEEAIPFDMDQVKKVEESLRAMGFITEIRTPYKDEGYAVREYEGAPEIPMNRERAGIYIGNSKEALENFHQAVMSIDDRALGRFFGIPETAIDAFVGDENERLYRQDLPDEIKQSDIYPFIHFVLSKDHWQEELEVIKGDAESVRRNSPKIFTEYVGYIRNMVGG
jgi:hypothetical protein